MRPYLILVLAAGGCMMPPEGDPSSRAAEAEAWVLLNCDSAGVNCETLSGHATEEECQTALAATTVLTGRRLECRVRG